MAVDELTRTRSGNNNDHLRRHNLSVILGLAHRTGGLSRAQLTKRTGLNRSTIAALVAELVGRQLVVEMEPDSSGQVGRPSPMVRPNPGAVGLAVNPEVDAITIGVVGLGGKVLKRIRYPTPNGASATETVAICAAVIEGMRRSWMPVTEPWESELRCLAWYGNRTAWCVSPHTSAGSMNHSPEC